MSAALAFSIRAVKALALWKTALRGQLFQKNACTDLYFSGTMCSIPLMRSVSQWLRRFVISSSVGWAFFFMTDASEMAVNAAWVVSKTLIR